MKVAWCTDLHLDFVSSEYFTSLFERIRNESDALIISGDIGEAESTPAHLANMVHVLGLKFPVYFVLGNHDYYKSSVVDVSYSIGSMLRGFPKMTWLTSAGVRQLLPGVGILGQDGWYDGVFGNWNASTVRLPDYDCIQDLVGRPKPILLQAIQALSKRFAANAKRDLQIAVKKYATLLFVTHVPPFRSACTHEGFPTDDKWLPHFSSAYMGAALTSVMADNPDTELLVLCGHTHSYAWADVLPNLRVLTGEAAYYAPDICRIFDL